MPDWLAQELEGSHTNNLGGERQAGGYRATRHLAADDRTFVTWIEAVNGPINLAVLGKWTVGSEPSH